MSQSMTIAKGNGANPNMVFLKYLGDKAEAVRKLAGQSTSQEWHFGYYRALKFIAETYTALKFPDGETVRAYIERERTRVLGDEAQSKDKKIKRRAAGCLKCFDDVLSDVGRLFSWALMITT
jgi:hypothetical protein